MRGFWILLLSIILCFEALAVPARRDKLLLHQPDGSSFYANFMGDEHSKIKLTENGEAIIQDESGWWCYAEYDYQGFKYSTGYRVGENVPSNILALSRNVPFAQLASRAAAKRKQAEYNRLERASYCLQKFSSELSQKDKAGLVILVQFTGAQEKFASSKAKDEFTAMLTQQGYSANGANGSAKEYFDQQFNGKYQFSFDVTDVVTVSQKRSYYGGNDKNGDDSRPHKMIMEACVLVDNVVDFTKYDQDGDGEVDNVFVFFAGLDEASGAAEEHIWSHSWYIKDGAGEELILDGVYINRYACASELEGSYYDKAYMTAIGTFCHEYSHTLGLPDFYDTDYPEGGFAAALWGSTALMDGGNYNNGGNTPPYFNAIEREILGLSKPVVIDSPGTFEMQSINNGVYYRINTSTTDEYFLLEYRDGTLWDEYIGGKGVLVYHIDKSMNKSGYSYLYGRDVTAAFRWATQVDINTLAEHQCADLIEADARTDIFSNYTDKSYVNLHRALKGIFFPYGNTNALTPVSTPGLKCWNNTELSLAVTDIAVKNGKTTFNVVSFSGKDMPTAINVKKEAFQDCAIVSFESSMEFSGRAKIEYGPSGGDTEVMYVDSYEPSKWAFELTGLESMTSYSVQISFVSGGAVGESVKTSFMTKKRNEGMLSYIYLGGVERNDDGTFKEGAALPLKVFNSFGAKEIRWKYNGIAIAPGKDMYYKVLSSGQLEANVYWEDGSVDVIMKDIRIK